jgi:prepilin-type N-terminal cleavage/methylation domain-containing protein
MIIRPTTSGFTLIELIVGMTIFSIGLAGIYALLQTTMSSVRYSQDEIIVSGLLREQIDLVNNMRDTSLHNYIPWDSALISTQNWSLYSSIFTGALYSIENDFTASGITFDPIANNGTIAKSPIKLTKIDTNTAFTTDAEKWSKTQLIFDDHGRYIHTGSSTGTGTNFASYIIVSPLGYTGSLGAFTEVKKDNKNQWWIIDARVVVKYNGGYREYDAKSMITDWQK